MKDKKRRTVKRRGSILDMFLIFLIFLSILGIGIRYWTLRSNSYGGAFSEYRLTVAIQNIRTVRVESLSVGDRVYTAAGEYYGRVSDIRVFPARTDFFSNGEYLVGEWEENVRCDIEVDIVFEGTQQAGRVLWKGTQACLVGQSTHLYTSLSLLKGTVTEVKKD